MRRSWPLFLVLLPSCLAAGEPEPPGLEMLEYLGGWQEEDEPGEPWVDPVGLYRAGLLGPPRYAEKSEKGKEKEQKRK